MATYSQLQQKLAELHLDERSEWLSGGAKNQAAVLAGIEEVYGKLANTGVGSRMLRKKKQEITVSNDSATLPSDFYELARDNEEPNWGLFSKVGNYYNPIDPDRIHFDVVYDVKNGDVTYEGQQQLSSGITNWTIGGPFNTYVGQSFLADQEKIGFVTIMTGSTTELFSNPVTVSLYAGNSTNPTGSALDSYVIPNSIWNSYPEQSEITVPITQNTTVGQRYWLVLNAATDAFQLTSLSGTNTNADASLIFASSGGGSGWTGQATNKAIYFKVGYVQNEVVSEYSLSFVNGITAGKYFVDYIPKPTIPSTGTDTVKLPSQVVESVADFALVEYFRRQQDWASVGNAMQYAEGKFAERVNRLWDNR